MAASQKRDSSTVSSKEKDSLLDMDIGNDFLTSWKSMSMAGGDGMDFDLTPGNKKSFNFDKADMDFNFDGDFGKVSSFNLDMPDLDISPPLKNDGKPSEKGKDSSSGKKKGKADPFAFAFDFDELDNFNFESSFTKECSKDQKEKSKKVSSTSGSECQEAEGSTHMKKSGSVTTLDDGPPNPSRPVAVGAFDMGRLDGGSADPEPTKENHSSNLAMDAVFTSGRSDAIHEITTDKAKTNREITDVSRELPKDSESEKFVSAEPLELEACSRNDVVRDLPSDSDPKHETIGGYLSEAHVMANSVNTNEAGSTRKQDVKVISFDSSFHHYTPTIHETVEVSEKKSIGNSKVVVADSVISKKQMPSRNDAVRDLSSDSLSKNEPTGANPSEAQAKANSVNTNATDKQDVHAISLDSSSCHHLRTTYEKSPLQTVEISEKSSSGTGEVGVEDHVVNRRQTPSGYDVARDLSSVSLSKTEPTGGNLSEAQDKVNSVITNETGSTRKQDFKVNSSSCHDTHTVYENSPLQTVEISEKRSSGKSKFGVEDHMLYKMQTPSRYDVPRDLPSVSLSKTEPTGGNLSEGQDKVNSVNTNETGSTRKQDFKVNSSSCHDTHTIYENSPLQTVEISEKRSSGKSKFGVEDHMLYKLQTPSRYDVPRDLPSVSLSKTEPTGGNLSEAHDKVNSVNANATDTSRKQDSGVISIVSSSFHHARTIHENSPLKTVDISEKKSNAKSKFRVDDHVINKQTPSSDDSVRDLSSASLSKNEPTGGNSSETQDKVNFVHANATGSDRKQDVNMVSLDSSSSRHHMFNSNFDSTKSLLRKYIKPVGNIGQKAQNRVLLTNTSSDVAHFPNSPNQMISILSTKRKTLEEDSASIITALTPSKRLAHSIPTSRNVVATQEKVLDMKVPDHSNMETESIKTTVGDSQLPTSHIPREANIKEVTMSFSIESDNIIKQAESYAKELVGLCNMLKKKHDEAKDILVQAVVNSNELLLLYSPHLDEKIFLQLGISLPDFNTEQHSSEQQFHQSSEETRISF